MDLLDITSDRTPSIAFRIINPRDPMGQREWAKQSAVRSVRPQIAQDSEGNRNPSLPQDTIEVHARYDEAEGFFGLTLYYVMQRRNCDSATIGSLSLIGDLARDTTSHGDR